MSGVFTSHRISLLTWQPCYMSGMLKSRSLGRLKSEFTCVFSVLADQSIHKHTLTTVTHTDTLTQCVHACMIYRVMLAVPRGILFKSLSLSLFLLYLHIGVPVGKLELIFNKTETATQGQTTIHASDFIFNLKATAAT